MGFTSSLIIWKRCLRRGQPPRSNRLCRAPPCSLFSITAAYQSGDHTYSLRGHILQPQSGQHGLEILLCSSSWPLLLLSSLLSLLKPPLRKSLFPSASLQKASFSLHPPLQRKKKPFRPSTINHLQLHFS